MTSQPPVRLWRAAYRDDDTGWISFGAFLIIVSVIYLITPDIARQIEAFLLDFQLVQIFPNFWFPLPSSNHPLLYTAAEQFCYIFGVVQIGILGVRFARRSSIHGKADTFSSVVFWLGAGYILSLLSRGVLLPISFQVP
jgi:hypothetical protein